jgi:hypothetical protein
MKVIIVTKSNELHELDVCLKHLMNKKAKNIYLIGISLSNLNTIKYIYARSPEKDDLFTIPLVNIENNRIIYTLTLNDDGEYTRIDNPSVLPIFKQETK